MGFLICRVSAFYAMSYEAVMRMPVRAFWMYSNCVDRVQAGNDQRALRIAICAQSGGEATAGLVTSLSEQMGTVVRFRADPASAAPDNRNGVAELRMLQATLGG